MLQSSIDKRPPSVNPITGEPVAELPVSPVKQDVVKNEVIKNKKENKIDFTKDFSMNIIR